jgi:hypothetical protein
MYWGADFIGFSVATFFMLVFFAIVAGIVYEVGLGIHAPAPKTGVALAASAKSLGIGGLIGGLVSVFLAYVIGGYTAGRMARFNGPRNGLGVALWTFIFWIALGVVGAVYGTKYDVLTRLHNAIDVGTRTLTVGGIVWIVIAVVVMLLGATAGGAMGARYQRRIDRDIGVAA